MLVVPKWLSKPVPIELPPDDSSIVRKVWWVGWLPPVADGPRHACHLPVNVRVDALPLLLKPDVESMLLRPGAVRAPVLDKCRVSAKLL